MAMIIVKPPREVGVTGKQFRDILRHDPCAYCGGAGGTVDHVIPRCRRVEHEGPRGLTGACWPCNQAKGDESLLLWLLHRAGALTGC